tara:strand:- start:424 stop:642 length:219 start_codon:yes stop_codon:yes gene_type:complete
LAKGKLNENEGDRMNTVILIIVLQVAVTLLTGCAEFPIAAKMEEIRSGQEEIRSEQLVCSGEDESLCAGWKI